MDITAPEPLPPFPAATMDGYAVVASDGEGVLEVSYPAGERRGVGGFRIVLGGVLALAPGLFSHGHVSR